MNCTNDPDMALRDAVRDAPAGIGSRAILQALIDEFVN